MDSIKIGNITMEMHKVKRLEEIIELVAEDDDHSDNELLISEIREITGCELDNDTIWTAYCSRYWSYWSLPQVIYALVNNGEYPSIKQYEIIFWKTSGKTDLTDEYIYENFLYRENKEIDYENILDCLSLSDIFAWIEKQFPLWNMQNDNDEDDDNLDRLHIYMFKPEEDKEYGITKEIMVSLYNQILEVQFQNIDENIRSDLAKYMKSLEYTVYY